MKILFYIEPLIEQDKPYWKDVWMDVFSRNIINTLNKSKNNYEFLIMTNEAIFQKVNIETRVIQLTQKELLEPFDTTNYLDVTTSWHCETFTKKQLENYIHLMSKKLDGFTPDIIITFSPVPFFKNMFRETLILHHEFSIFSRLPYPQSWFLDPVGIHSNLFLNKFANQIKSSVLSENQIKLVNDFKELCQNMLFSKSPFKAIFEEKRKHFDHLVLLPLQFSRYYSFDDLVPFKSQYEYCVYILDNIPLNIGVVINTHPEYKVLSKDAIEFLKIKYSNFIYEEDFDNVYASGQLILPFVDAVITVSSSIGLQTLLFNKKLITLSDKTFSFIADDTNINNIENVLKSDSINKNSFLYFILTKYSITSEYLHNTEWLDNFLHKSLLDFRTNKVQFDFYKLIDEEEKIFDLLSKTLHSNKKLIPSYVVKNFIQLFIEKQNGINEENFIKYQFTEITELKTFEFDLKDFKNIKNLRLDVLNNSCVINIEKLYLILEDNSTVDLKNNIQTNCYTSHGDNYFFESVDPQIYFHNINFTDLIIKKLIINLKCNHIEDSTVYFINQICNDKNKIIEKKDRIINSLNDELTRIYMSKIWKETSSLRSFSIKLKNYFKREPSSMNKEYKRIKESGLFDEKYYLEKYKDIKNIDPIQHYIQKGWKEERNPSKQFNTNIYLKDNPELKNKNICPLLHYILEKKKEKRNFYKNTFLNVGKLIKHINKHNLNRFIYHIKNRNFFLIKEKISFYTNNKLENMKIYLIENTIDNNYEILEFKPSISPLVSIIIPVYNQFDFTYKCLKSILLNTKNIDYEIIIVDDVSSDMTININEYVKNINVIRNKNNLGFLLNCNNAVKLAKGKYIHLLNNDTQVQNGWLNSLIELIESNDKIGMVGSKLIYPDGRQQEAGGIIWDDASGWNFGRLDSPMKSEYNYVKEVDYISGASILITKKLWDKIGGFDERYVPAYFEDSDLAFEVRKHGFKVMFQPKSVVIHFEGISHGTNVITGIKSYQVKNRKKFVEKWKKELETNHFPNAKDLFLARDRSKNKKRILIIDHYVPHFDKDAGSRTVFSYIKLFLKNDYKITFIGDNYFKHEPYSSMLEQLGVEILYGIWYSNNHRTWLNQNLKYFDYAFINRPHISNKYINLLTNFKNLKIVYYGHDLHFLRIEREYLLTKNNSKLKDLNYWKDLEFNLMKKANISLYPSSVETEKIFSIDKEINVKAIPAYLFEDFSTTTRDISVTKNIMFIGSFSHDPNVDAIIWFINNIWIKVKKSLQNIKLYIIGSNPNNKILSLQCEDIIVTKFITDEKLKEYYNKCRISITPLRYGAGIKGKIVEALYNQIPIVTTSVGAEGLESAEDYMIIEDDEKLFADKLISLYNDTKKLEELSQKGKLYCKKYFSYEKAENVLKDVFDFGDNK